LPLPRLRCRALPPPRLHRRRALPPSRPASASHRAPPATRHTPPPPRNLRLCPCLGPLQPGLPLRLAVPRAATARPSPLPRATAGCYCHPRALAGKWRRSRMEPRKRGSTSRLKAARGIASSTPGAGAISTVWQGSERSHSWSCSWSPAK
jgi:hypothetical protein